VQVIAKTISDLYTLKSTKQLSALAGSGVQPVRVFRMLCCVCSGAGYLHFT